MATPGATGFFRLRVAGGDGVRSGFFDKAATTGDALGRPARADAAAVGFAFADTLPAATSGRAGDLTAGLTAGLAASDLTAGFREVTAPVFATDLAVLDAATAFFDDFTAVALDALRTGAAAILVADLTAGLMADFAATFAAGLAADLAFELEVFATAVAFRTAGTGLAAAGRVTLGVEEADFLAEAGAAVPDEEAAVWADVAMERLQKIAIPRIVSGPVRSEFLGTRYHY